VRYLHRLMTRYLFLPAILHRGGVDYSRFRREMDEFYGLDTRERSARQMERLRNLALHAYECSEHYHNVLEQAGIGRRELQQLQDIRRLPILEKQTLSQAGPGPFLTGHARGAVTTRTTGTTGRPVTVLLDPSGHARQVARRNYLLARLGVDFAGPEARLWGRTMDVRREAVIGLITNRKVFTFNGTDEECLMRELTALRRYRPTYIYGYASIILRAATLMRERGWTMPGLTGVVSTAETLSEHARITAQEVFRCPVWQEYGCSECDIISFPCRYGGWHILEDHLILEVDPETSEAIITDLDNRLMPLLRYRLGDRLHLSNDRCECGWSAKRLVSIEGRHPERYVELPDGRRLHAVLFAQLFERLQDRGLTFAQFKVQQRALNRVHVIVDETLPQEREIVSHLILSDLARTLGNGIAVDVEYGPIPVDPGRKYTYFDALP